MARSLCFILLGLLASGCAGVGQNQNRGWLPKLPTGDAVRAETAPPPQQPQVSLIVQAQPAVVLGQEIDATVRVTNTGQGEMQEMAVRYTIPEGVQLARSEPAGSVEGNQVIWTLGPLAAGQSHRLVVYLQPARLGPVASTASVVTREGLQAEKRAVTEVTQPKLAVAISAATTGVVGVAIPYEITIRNTGSGSVANVVLFSEFDQGLEHEAGGNRLEKSIGVLASGASKVVSLSLTPRQRGQFLHRVTATGDGNLVARSEHALDVHTAQLGLQTTAPARRFVGAEAALQTKVVNQGEIPLTNVVVRSQLPAEVTLMNANEGGQPVNGDVVWNLGNLQPREEKTLTWTVRCTQRSPKAVIRALATADSGQQTKQEAAFEILGVPAFKLAVEDLKDPVEVNGQTTYRITVTNQGSLPGNTIDVVAILPVELKVVSAGGVAEWKTEAGVRPGEQRVVFKPIDALPVNQALTYTIGVQAQKPGDQRIRVELRTATLREPVFAEESTIVFDPRGGQK